MNKADFIIFTTELSPKQMRSIFRFYIFESLRNFKCDCKECGGIKGDLLIDEDGCGDIPASFFKWPPVNKDLEEQYSQEQLRKCPLCGSCFAYEISQPGGSYDAMVTINRERLYRIGYLEAYLLLRESEEHIEELLKRDPKYYRIQYDTHQKGMAEETELLRKNPLLIKEAIDFFTIEMSKKTKYYTKQVPLMEDEVASIVSGCLFSLMKTLPEEYLFSLLKIICSSREKLSKELASAFSFGVFNLSGEKTKVEVLINFIKTLPANNEIKKIDEQLKDFFRPPKAVTKFYSLPAEIEVRISDTSLKNHLEKLPGLVVDNYIEAVFTEAMIDFTFGNFNFSADNYNGWRFYVEGDCPDETLKKIVGHLEKY